MINGEGDQLLPIEDIQKIDFPRYDQPSSHFVREYLNGHYGTAQEVGPYTASLFYALDRFEAAGQIRDALAEGKIVLSNRFTASSMAHQGGKFAHAEERRGYFIWLDNLEFLLLKIPRPDMNFVLRVPAEIAQNLVDEKNTRSYTDRQRDIHEADLDHLQRSVQTYDDLCSLFPQDFQRIDCVRGDQLLPIEDIQKIVWEKVSTTLPKPAQKTNTKVAATKPSEPEPPETKPTSQRKTLSFLAQITLARNQKLTTGDATNFAQRDPSGKYRYHLPKNLPEDLVVQYAQSMDSIFELYSEMQFRLQDYLLKSPDTVELRQQTDWRVQLANMVSEAINGVLPLATQSTASLSKPVDTAVLPELTNDGQQEISALPTSSGLLEKLAKNSLKETYNEATDGVQLAHVWPRNELDLVVDILFPYSGMSLLDIQSTVSDWNYDQKAATLIAYAADPARDPTALSTCRYQFDIVSNISTLYEAVLGAHYNMTWQTPTPRYGYDMPELIEAANLSELYERCFDVSLELHSLLQSAGHERESSYAVLSGHKVRWQLQVNGHELLEELPRTIKNLLREKALTRHPLLLSEYQSHKSA